jgi:hypothetical protein
MRGRGNALQGSSNASTSGPGSGKPGNPPTSGSGKPGDPPTSGGKPPGSGPSWKLIDLDKVANIIDKVGDRIVDPIASIALEKLAAGGSLAASDIGALKGFLADHGSLLTAKERRGFNEFLADAGGSAMDVMPADRASVGSAITTPAPSGWIAATGLQYECKLKVKNDTRERVTIWVQHRTRDDDGAWTWLPANPQSRKAVSYELAPGEETYLARGDEPMTASRVRLWARSAGGESWLDYKSEDLWLIEEVDANGEHAYAAGEIDTYTFTLR